MGFNPQRKMSKTPADYAMVVGAIVVCVLLLAWAFFGLMWPWADDEVEVRRVQPYQAAKRYTCPGCLQDIPTGTGHLVAVPIVAPDERRHWHHGCWQHKATRKPGRHR